MPQTAANCPVAQILGKAWNEESTAVRAAYHQQALEIKEAFLRRFPTYSYKPRRPGQIKKRVKKTRRTQQTPAGDGMDDPQPVEASSSNSPASIGSWNPDDFINLEE
jgi:hypothetical protein